MKIKNFIKENYKFLITLLILVICLYIKLPYYAMAPGGTINITDRVVMQNYDKNKDGSLNMLYVSEYELTPGTYIVAKLKHWDIEKESTRRISNESTEEVKERNKIMRDNSLDIATMVAYTSANKKIDIKKKTNIVIATTKENGLKVGDIILKADNIECEDIKEIKQIISSKNIDDTVEFTILRNNKEMKVTSKISNENNTKAVGVIIITEYEYDLDPKVDIKFKSSEAGASGGLMLTLTVYNAISDEDIIKGRNIAGTGTISADGSVGEIDGIKYKIMGAAKDKMDIVFVPPANYKEAIETKEKYNYKLNIIKVDNFNEAVDYLRNN